MKPAVRNRSLLLNAIALAGLAIFGVAAQRELSRVYAAASYVTLNTVAPVDLRIPGHLDR